MDELSSIFSALADPTRRTILARLAHGEATVGELASPFDMSLPAVSRHLRVLRKARLIQHRIDAQRRVCRINTEPLLRAATWIDAHRQFWEGGFDRLAEFLSRNDLSQRNHPSSTTDPSNL
ncbi:metalloregulator ArsR/SmtB family transcription factor [Dyella sp. 2HG41-7]|uniref:ArsR/SmtB family transcription factor n=1 Tax=Dyella sp. 2HG41-7 TaxID=2883239 RepID=UPI001F1D0A85|nr:metalloregulator ArsR/SmtB family transcription factor [Dyella sp. 2HG41-7]